MKPYIVLDYEKENITNKKEISLTLDSSYIPGGKLNLDKLYLFNVKELLQESYSQYEYVGETIERISKELILEYKFDITKRNFYAFIIREITRNVVEHSKADSYLLAIYIGKEKEIGFKVVDNGIGIKKSLNMHPHYNVTDHITALAFAIRPGITKSYKKDPNRDEVWQNSGFGLYMVSSIADNIGYFNIASGDSLLMSKNSVKSYYKYKIKGTEVTIVLKNNIKINTSTMLKEIAQKGNKFAKNSPIYSKYAEVKTASKASTLLD